MKFRLHKKNQKKTYNIKPTNIYTNTIVDDSTILNIINELQNHNLQNSQNTLKNNTSTKTIQSNTSENFEFNLDYNKICNLDEPQKEKTQKKFKVVDPEILKTRLTTTEKRNISNYKKLKREERILEEPKQIEEPISYKVESPFTINRFKESFAFIKKRAIDTSHTLENKVNSFRGERLTTISKQTKIRMAIIIFLIIIITRLVFAWFYSEYTSKGTLLGVGNIECTVKQYDSTGNFIQEFNDTGTIIHENDISVTTKTTKFIEIENTGTLDAEYNITFQLDGADGNAGIMYYRLYDITEEVKGYTISNNYNTKLKAYANANPISNSLEFDTARPVSNMTTISTSITNGTITLDPDFTENNIRYYRLDYGMYSNANSAIYANTAFSLHTKVYVSQVGADIFMNNEGETWVVENEQQFRNAASNALPGDTIKLVSDISIDGSVNISRRIHLNMNEYKLSLTGDLVYDFVDLGTLKIDTTSSGCLEVGNNIYINTPKSTIHFIGSNTSYDVFAGGTITFNGLQNNEDDGVLLENTRIVNNKVGNVPANIYLMSNTRLTVGPNVSLGNVIATPGSTNIEILNNGSIVQILLNDMTLLDTFTKPQIYIYNLNVILGVLNGSAIVLPATSTPYLGPNDGNTLIIKGANSSDVTVSGSTNFTQEDISYVDIEDSVVPIAGEPNSYIVYIRDSQDSIRQLLIDYFTTLNSVEPADDIALIKKLVVYTVNAQYVDNEDFDFLKSSEIPALEYLSLENAKVIDSNTVNRIKANALYNKTSLNTIVLPKILTEIGEGAFYNVPLGKIPSGSGNFVSVTIPDTVTTIELNAFNASKYITFEGLNPPSISLNAFASDSIYFVPENSILLYQNITALDAAHVHKAAFLSDNKTMFIYNTVGGMGLSLYVSTLNVGDTLSIPNTIMHNNREYYITELGTSSFRHIETPITGTNIILPTRITKINDYAFYNKNITNINLENILTLGNYAFYNTKLSNITGNLITSIGNSTFELSTVTSASFDALITLGNSAFSENTHLYEINLGHITSIGNKALYHCPNLGIIHFKNNSTKVVNNAETIDLSLGNDSVFSEWGQYLDGRLRVYVPEGSSASGKTYLELYKTMFSANSQYIYTTGTIYGSYQHGAIAYNFGEYTVREVNLINGLNTINGWEIISYQGADLASNYNIPTSLIINGVEKQIISIGQNAFSNSTINTGAIVNLSNSALYNIGEKAFYNVGINSATMNSVKNINNEAFTGTNLTFGKFENLENLGNGVFKNLSTLYSLNLGTVKTIGAKAIDNNINLEQLFFANSDINNMTINEENFTALGTNTRERLRIYVPADNASLLYYKTVLTDYSVYIYEAGTLIGSYINSPIPYDIGEYTIKEIALPNILGNTTVGWEIIEYHGADITTGYQLPTSLTINDTTRNVISIGDSAFMHSTYSTGFSVDITNNNLINIGPYAFAGSSGINSFTANSLRTLGDHAFDCATLQKAEFANLHSIGSYALANMSNLYIINLGTVTQMSANALCNLDKLQQVFFDANTIAVNFDMNAISNVGEFSNDRMRIYVTDANGANSKPYVETYKALFNADIRDYFYPKGTIVGNFTQPNIPYDIGEYSTRTVTLTDQFGTSVTGLELIEYHGDDLSIGDDLIVNNTLTSIDIGASLSYINSWQTNDYYTCQYNIVITNNGSTDVSSWEVRLNRPAGMTMTNGWNITYTEHEDYISFTGNSVLAAGQSTSNMQIEFNYTENTFTPNFTLGIGPKVNATGTAEYISIGANAYSHVATDTDYTVSLKNHNILQIGEKAFNNFESLTNVELINTEFIGNYGFSNNKLVTAKFRNLLSIGNYGLSNNITLNHVNLGTATTIGDNLFLGDTRLAQVIFSNTNGNTNSSIMNMSVPDNLFDDVSLTMGDRFRIYVPGGNLSSNTSYVEAYKNTFQQSIRDYIFANGYCVGNEYIYAPVTYDIKEYTVRKVTLPEIDGTLVTGWEISDYHGPNIAGNYNIPTTFTANGETLPVISIGDYAFNKVLTVNDATWNLNLNINIINIGKYAFTERKIGILNAVNITTVGAHAFENCEYLTTVAFNGLKSLNDYAFNSNSRMTSVTLGSDLVSLGNYSLYNTYTGGPNGSVGPNTTFNISAMVAPSLGNNVFPDCTSLAGTVYCNFYIYIANGATGYTIPPWPDRIQMVSYSGTFEYVILNATSVKLTGYSGTASNLTIPNTLNVGGTNYNVTGLGAKIFDNNLSLTSITLPQYLNSIEDQFLAGNTNISYINVDANNQVYKSINGLLFSFDGNTLIKYPNGNTATSYTISNNTVAAGAFSGAIHLQIVYISQYNCTLSPNSFVGCTNLQTVKITWNAVPFLLGSNVFPDNPGFVLSVSDPNSYRTKLNYGGYNMVQYTSYP